MGRKKTDRKPFGTKEADEITELFTWATYPGHLDESVSPPPVDLAKLAAAVRLLIELNSRLNDDQARRLAEHEEIAALRKANATYAAKVNELRRELSKARGEGPQTEGATSANEEATETKPAKRRAFRFPEDRFKEGKRGRPARSD